MAVRAEIGIFGHAAARETPAPVLRVAEDGSAQPEGLAPRPPAGKLWRAIQKPSGRCSVRTFRKVRLHRINDRRNRVGDFLLIVEDRGAAARCRWSARRCNHAPTRSCWRRRVLLRRRRAGSSVLRLVSSSTLLPRYCTHTGKSHSSSSSNAPFWEKTNSFEFVLPKFEYCQRAAHLCGSLGRIRCGCRRPRFPAYAPPDPTGRHR